MLFFEAFIVSCLFLPCFSRHVCGLARLGCIRQAWRRNAEWRKPMWVCRDSFSKSWEKRTLLRSWESFLPDTGCFLIVGRVVPKLLNFPFVFIFNNEYKWVREPLIFVITRAKVGEEMWGCNWQWLMYQPILNVFSVLWDICRWFPNLSARNLLVRFWQKINLFG